MSGHEGHEEDMLKCFLHPHTVSGYSKFNLNHQQHFKKIQKKRGSVVSSGWKIPGLIHPLFHDYF